MRWRLLICGATALAAAGAVALAVRVASTGFDGAAGLAGVVAALCELVAAGLAVAGWADRRHRVIDQRGPVPDSGGAVGGRAVPEPDGRGAGKYTVDTRGAWGVQIGDGNTQHNDVRAPRRSTGEGAG